MKKLRIVERYSNFRDELLLEGIINESILYFSPRVKSILKGIDKEISNELLSLHKTDIKPDVTFVDLDKEGYLSFTTMKSAIKNLITDFNGTEDSWLNSFTEKMLKDLWELHEKGHLPNDVYTKSRNSIKIGKLVNKISTKKYTDKEVEDFVNSFKATIIYNQEKFEIIEGDEIAFWYDESKYLNDKGSLGSSCMADMSKDTFNIYTKNPQVCRMLILKEGDKISGRALVWKIPNILDGVEYFMDRQYTNKDSDVDKFRNFAKEQGNWISKSNNTHYNYKGVIHHQDSDNRLKLDMEIQLLEYNGSYDYNTYPYVDTFRRYDRTKGILYNDDGENFDGDNNILLQDTYGDYEILNNGIWSDYHGDYIPRGEEIYSEVYGDYLYRDQATYIDGYEWYHQDDEDIVKLSNGDYIHKDDASYSNTDGEWYRLDDTVNVIIDLNNDGDVIEDDRMHENSNNMLEFDQDLKWYECILIHRPHSGWDDFLYILSTLMIENYNSDYIPKLFKMDEVYKVKKSSSDIKFLTKLDSELLKIEIDTTESFVIDIYEYHYGIHPYFKKLSKILIDQIKYLSSMIKDKGQLRLKLDNDKEYLEILKNKNSTFSVRLELLEEMIEVI